MANIKSVKKRIKTAERNRKNNVSRRSTLKTLFKKLSAQTDPKESVLLLNEFYKVCDQTKDSAIHPNKRNRYKAKAARRIKQICCV